MEATVLTLYVRTAYLETVFPRPARLPPVPHSLKSKSPQGTRRDAVINLRLPLRTRDLIDEAAALSGKSRTEFMVDSARRQATETLIDQRLFELDASQWTAFVKALDAPPAPNRKLKALMGRANPWET